MSQHLCRGGIDDQSSVDASDYSAQAVGAMTRPREAGNLSGQDTPAIRGGESGILGGTNQSSVQRLKVIHRGCGCCTNPVGRYVALTGTAQMDAQEKKMRNIIR